MTLTTGYVLTDHAITRIHARGFSVHAVNAALVYGRRLFVRGAEIFALGRREIDKLRRVGVNLGDLEGLQVVCCPCSKTVLTAYRNRNFRELRPRHRRRRGKACRGFRDRFRRDDE